MLSERLAAKLDLEWDHNYENRPLLKFSMALESLDSDWFYNIAVLSLPWNIFSTLKSSKLFCQWKLNSNTTCNVHFTLWQFFSNNYFMNYFPKNNSGLIYYSDLFNWLQFPALFKYSLWYLSMIFIQNCFLYTVLKRQFGLKVGSCKRLLLGL